MTIPEEYLTDFLDGKEDHDFYTPFTGVTRYLCIYCNRGMKDHKSYKNV